MPSIINAQVVEEKVFAFEGVRVVIVTGTRKRKLEVYPYEYYNKRKLPSTATVAGLKRRIDGYIGKDVVVIKGDGTVAKDEERLGDVRKSYSK